MGMEDETREFLVRILNTIAIVLVWMMLNVFFGFYKNYAFFETKPDWTNYLFYIFFCQSCYAHHSPLAQMEIVTIA